MSCPIAIVGMACRYPDANTVEELFENSLAQRRAFRRIPEVRLAGAGYFDESGQAKDRAYVRQAAVIKGFKFDRAWFRVSEPSYEVTDPTHWLALTVAKETIEDIRFHRARAHPNNDAVRVVVGNTLTGEFSRSNLMRLRWPYVRAVVAQHLRAENPCVDEAQHARLLRDLEARYKKPFPIPNEDFLAGGLANTIAGRICNHFDFKGGGYTVDGACSSSLLAVTDGCSALASGDADMVLAGGVDLSLDPFELVGFSRTAALARTEMLVYDEQSEGFWPGEGCGFVALMRYDDALEQCERVHAVIRGWGISSDGRGGLTRPEPEGQRLALQRAYARAGYGIESVGYFEGHGTGTRVGDSAELTALISARRDSGNAIHPAVISSIKANIGHTKAAAGLAGLLRATKCVNQHILPPTTACRRPHALLVENADNLSASDRLRDWKPRDTARRAGISAMGFGGINTHVTIEETPTAARPTLRVLERNTRKRMEVVQDSELFLFAAARRDDLAWTIDHIAGFADACSRAELIDLAAELGRRAARGALTPWKAAIVAATPTELGRKLQQLKESLGSMGEDGVRLAVDDGFFVSGGNVHGRIGLLFSGQGAPLRPDGGIHARRFDEVRRSYRKADLDSFENRENTGFAQPAIAAASLGGIGMLQRIGTHGDVAVGHSLGELAALHWAGCFDDDALMNIARARGKATVDDTNTTGAMAAVAATREQTAAALGGRGNVFVANINSPRQTVVSGDREEIAALAASLQREGIPVTVLPVNNAFHTPAMAGVAKTLRQSLAAIDFHAAQGEVISTVTGRPVPDEADIAAHLCDQLVSPVHFLPAARLAARKVDLFIEVGPGDLISNLTRSFSNTPVISMDVGGESLSPFLRAAASTYVLGCAPAIGRLFDDRFARRFDWNWNPQFFENPCEVIPADTEPEPANDPAQAPPQTQIAATAVHGSTCDRLRQIVADRTGLPAWTLEDGSRMLSDLHLNSITVGEIVARATASVGLPPPADPTEYADASIREIAGALDHLKESGYANQLEPQRAPAGVDTWVRYFEMGRVPATRLHSNSGLQHGEWQGFGAVGQKEEALLDRLNTGPYGSGVIIWLSDYPDVHETPSLLHAAQHCSKRAKHSDDALRFVIVQHGWGAGGFARSYFIENKSITTLVINLPGGRHPDLADQITEEIAGSPQGFTEIFIDADGRREEARMRLSAVQPAKAPALLNDCDVVLVTGGGKGISAECGFQLAGQTGCGLLILGRSAPQGSPELATNLQRMREANLRVSYQRADVTDGDAVTTSVAAGIAELGSPVTAIVHGAGLNHPRAVLNLSQADIEATISPKTDGLRNLLTSVDPDQLKLLVTFSSIIARIGLRGEADYALGNEWLSHATEEFQQRHSDCRCRAIEWSVWSGAGMGQRLGRLDALVSQGISPISIDEGVREFLRLVNTPDLPTCLIVSGRYGTLPTAGSDPPSMERFRFIESIPVYYPETELIAEFHLSPESDPYLDDHVLNGERIFPAVMALEAMTEAAVALMSMDSEAVVPVFDDVVFRKAIVAAKTEALTVRVAVLAAPDGEISLAIRCSATSFQVNHVEARCTLQDAPGSGPDLERSEDPCGTTKGRLHSSNPELALYQNVLFQNGRFKRIQGYQQIEARRCRGQLSPDGTTKWFSQDLPQLCLLGDPGARDAALHAIQACIPHKIVIPVAVGKIETAILDPFQSYGMVANEIADRGDELIYDLTILDPVGRPVERWRRITLRVVGEPSNLPLNSPPLVGAFFERHVSESRPDAKLKVHITPASDDRSKRNGTASWSHRSDGKPDPPSNSRFQSAAYGGDWKLSVDSATPVGCDLQGVRHNGPEDWESLLGTAGLALAALVAEFAREPLDVSATRIWTAREAMKKAGLVANAPLVFDPDSSAHWVVLSSGDTSIFSSLLDSEPAEEVICVATALCPAPSQPESDS